MASKAAPKPKFMMLGSSKFVHTAYTKAVDLKSNANGGSGCMQLRKMAVAGKIDYRKPGLSPEAAMELPDCVHCETHAAAKVLLPKEDRKAKRDETMDKIKDSVKTGGQLKREAKAKDKARAAKDKPVKAGKVKAEPKVKGDKPAKAAKGKGGVRSTGSSTEGKAAALVEFAKEHGWDAKVGEVKGEPGMLVTALRGDETIRCWFVDGKYDTARHASLTVGDWTGKLRGVHGCRKQMAAEGRDRPHPSPGTGRSASRKGKSKDEPEVSEDESPDDAARRVPFSMDDDDLIVMKAMLGKTIRWRNSQSGSVEEAWLPAEYKGKRRDKVAMTTHPKTGERMISFLTVVGVTEHGEQYGPERTVSINRIIRVLG